jgi:hypothetical protein
LEEGLSVAVAESLLEAEVVKKLEEEETPKVVKPTIAEVVLTKVLLNKLEGNEDEVVKEREFAFEVIKLSCKDLVL